MVEIKAFNKWSVEGIKVQDAGLERYICLQPTFVPKTGARYAGKRFHKSKVFIVERFINKIMGSGHKAKKHVYTSEKNTGKAQTAYKIFQNALEIVEFRSKKNPIAVLVKALENAAPREEIITIEYGGARYPKAVECAPQRRIDMVIKLMAQGVYQKTFATKKHAADAWADEIMAAYNLSSNSVAIQKKLELERQADSSR